MDRSIEGVCEYLSLPAEIAQAYARLGVRQLYEWQAECLRTAGVLEGGNLIYSAPTSGGKTLVAELLMLRNVIHLKKKAVLVLPYVCLAAEKTKHIKRILLAYNKTQPKSQRIKVKGLFGAKGGEFSILRCHVAICTIEKANIIINFVIKLKSNPVVNASQRPLGCVCIDELHVLSDIHRGFLLELLVCKLRFNQSEDRVQIVGLSATMGNLPEMSNCFGAQLYITSYRPVPLQDFVVHRGQLHAADGSEIALADVQPKDPDGFFTLVVQGLQKGQQLLVFCHSRKGCEITGKAIAMHLAQHVTSMSMISHRDAEEVSPTTLQSRRKAVVDKLAASEVCVDKQLAELVMLGIAYHHAGLTEYEREIIEDAYRDGLVSLLCATTTLAAGVNLPAGRVIIRRLKANTHKMDVCNYRQMAGRAGRAGQSAMGEAFLICPTRPEFEEGMVLLRSELPPVQSALDPNRDGGAGLLRALLEAFALGLVNSCDGCIEYIRYSLCYCQCHSAEEQEGVLKTVHTAFDFLLRARCIEPVPLAEPQQQQQLQPQTEGAQPMRTSRLGNAIIRAGLSPEEGMLVFEDLQQAIQFGLVLSHPLHLMYLITPYTHNLNPDFQYLAKLVQRQANVPDSPLLAVLHAVTLEPERFDHWALQPPSYQTVFSATSTLRSARLDQAEVRQQVIQVHRVKRLFAALALCDMQQFGPVKLDPLAQLYKTDAGELQNLYKSTQAMCHVVARFAEELGWTALRSVIMSFASKFDVQKELQPLMQIVGMTMQTAKSLHDQGLTTPYAIASAHIDVLAQALLLSSTFQAKRDSGDRAAATVAATTSSSTSADQPDGLAMYRRFAAVLQKRAVECVESTSLQVADGVISTVTDDGHGSDTGSDNRNGDNEDDDSSSASGWGGDGNDMLEDMDDFLCQLGGEKWEEFRLDDDESATSPTKQGKRERIEAEFCQPPGAAGSSSEHFPLTTPKRAKATPEQESVAIVEGDDVVPELGAEPDAAFESQVLSAFTPAKLAGTPQRYVFLPECNEPQMSPSALAHNRAEPSPDNSTVMGAKHLASFKHAQEFMKALVESRCFSFELQYTSLPKGLCAIRWQPFLALQCAGDSSLVDHTSVIRGISFCFGDSYGYYLPLPTPLPRCTRPPTASQPSGSTEAHRLSTQRLTLDQLPSRAATEICAFVGFGRMMDKAGGLTRILLGHQPDCLSNPLLVVSKYWCWKARETMYVEWRRGACSSWKLLSEMMADLKYVKVAAHMQVALLGLRSRDIIVRGPVMDPTVGLWMLRPDLPERMECPSFENAKSYERCCYRAVNAMRQMCAVERRLKDNGLWSAFANVEMNATRVLANIQATGIPIQRPFFEQLRQDLFDKLTCIQFYVDCQAGGSVNLDSPAEVARALRSCVPELAGQQQHQDQGPINVRMLARTIAHPMPRLICEWRSLKHGVDLCHGILASMSGNTVSNRIHARCDQQTSTGRVAFLMPPLQQIPHRFMFRRVHRQNMLQEIERNGSAAVKEAITPRPDARDAPHRKLAMCVSTAAYQESGPSPDGMIYPGIRICEVLDLVEGTMADRIRGLEPCTSLGQYWRSKGFPYPPEQDGRIPLVSVKLGNAHLSFPADKVYRLLAPTALDPADVQPSTTTDPDAEQRHWWEPWGRPVCVNPRQGFKAGKGRVFLSVDYSQIELRIMAHFSRDQGLCEAFRSGGDVFHALTAAWRNVDVNSVTKAMRNETKQVCYGILYGAGMKQLAEVLQISVLEARDIQRSFNSMFPGIARFIANTKAFCRKRGYIETILGRRRYLPAITSANPSERAQAERQAVNTICQGSAADLIKLAMINIEHRLDERFPQFRKPRSTPGCGLYLEDDPCRLVLQIHDELLFEVKEEFVAEVRALVKECMEQAIRLDVPIEVKSQVGATWADMS